MLQSQPSLDTALIFACVVILSLLALALYGAVTLARAVGRALEVGARACVRRGSSFRSSSRWPRAAAAAAADRSTPR